jgi:hypothetical protein
VLFNNVWELTLANDIIAQKVCSTYLDSWLRETPCTCIQWFFLAPDDGLRIWIHVQILLQLLPRERIQLLDTCNRHVLDALLSTVLVKGYVHLASTEDDSVNLLWFVDGSAMFGVFDDPFELRITSKFFNR